MRGDPENGRVGAVKIQCVDKKKEAGEESRGRKLHRKAAGTFHLVLSYIRIF